jgi:uncharacterized protein (TIGR00369 family)
MSSTMTGLDTLTEMVAGRIPPPPVAQLIGLELLEVKPDRALFGLSVDRRHQNPMGTLHGGILCDLGDAAMGCAVATGLAPAQSYTTIELKINYFKPVRQERLVATATVIRRTRKLAYAEAEVRDEGGSLVAKLASTCLVLSGEDAQGR